MKHGWICTLIGVAMLSLALMCMTGKRAANDKVRTWGAYQQKGDARWQEFDMDKTGFLVAYYPGGKEPKEAAAGIESRYGLKDVILLSGGFFDPDTGKNVDLTIIRGVPRVYYRHDLHRPAAFFGSKGVRILYPGRQDFGMADKTEQFALAGMAKPPSPNVPLLRHIIFTRKYGGKRWFGSIKFKATYKQCVAHMKAVEGLTAWMQLDGKGSAEDGATVPSYIVLYEK